MTYKKRTSILQINPKIFVTLLNQFCCKAFKSSLNFCICKIGFIFFTDPLHIELDFHVRNLKYMGYGTLFSFPTRPLYHYISRSSSLEVVVENKQASKQQGKRRFEKRIWSLNNMIFKLDCERRYITFYYYYYNLIGSCF